MILAAGLLVLLGLGLFLGGILTGVTALYWACVGACLVAAVLLVLARRGMSAVSPDPEPAGAATQATAAGSVAGAVQPAAPERATETAAAPAPVDDATTSGAPAATPPEDLGEPPVEDVEVTDLLLAVDLKDEVLVVDEHPRYHLAGCVHLAGRTAIPLPHDEARTDGFTPCGVCEPDRHLADRVRARRADGDS